jgi:hypothetical protein
VTRSTAISSNALERPWTASRQGSALPWSSPTSGKGRPHRSELQDISLGTAKSRIRVGIATLRKTLLEGDAA